MSCFTFDPGDFKRIPSAKYRTLFFLEKCLTVNDSYTAKSLFFWVL